MPKTNSNNNVNTNSQQPRLDCHFTAEENLTINEWSQWIKDLNPAIKKANEANQKHAIRAQMGSNLLDTKDITLIQNLIADLLQIQTKVTSIETKMKALFSQALQVTNTTRIAFFKTEFKELKNCKYDISMALIQLNKTLAAKYHYKFTSYSTGKKQNIEIAFRHIETAKSLFTANQIAESDDPEFSELHAKIKGKWFSYCNEKTDKVREAIDTKDKELAFTKFQELIDLAENENNPARQVELLFLQTERYAVLSTQEFIEQTSKQESKKRLSAVSKLYFASEKVLQVLAKVTNKSQVSTQIIDFCNINFKLASDCLENALSFKSHHDSEEIEAFLKSAQQHCELGLTFTKHIEDNVKLAEFDKSFTSLLAKINQQKSEFEQKQQQDKQQAKDISNKIEEYNRTFSEKIKLVFHESNINNNNSNAKTEAPETGDDKSDQMSEIDEYAIEFEAEPIFEEEAFHGAIDPTVESAVQMPRKNVFDLSQPLAELKTAEETNNLIKKSAAQTQLGQCYYREACILKKRHLPAYLKIPGMVEHLRIAMEHLSLSIQAINEAIQTRRSNDIAALQHQKDWTLKILNDTRSLISTTLHRQEKLKKQFKQARQLAMNDIIQKHGEEKWFKSKPGEVNWETLSLPAKRLANIKKNVTQLKKLNSDIIDLICQTTGVVITAVSIVTPLATTSITANLGQTHFGAQDNLARTAAAERNRSSIRAKW